MKWCNHYLLFLFLTTIVLGVSCKKDFLDVPDKSVVLRQAYVVDLTTTEHYLNGIYVRLGGTIFGMSLAYPELIADNIKPVTGQLFFSIHYMWEQQEDDARNSLSNESKNVNFIWRDGYQIIRDCSFILENIDKYRTENPGKADDIRGQAYAIRALIHFVLVNTFAQSYNFTPDGSHTGVPYVTTSDWTEPISRQTVAEVYNGMLSDLNNAVQLLPATSTNKLLFNLNATKALMARIYLTKGDYTTASRLSREVATNVPIMTGALYPSKLFTPQETEALFQLPPAEYDSPDGAGTYYTSFSGILYFYNMLVATSDIADILNEDSLDKRSKWVKLEETGWKITKFPTGVIPTLNSPGGSYYQTLLRSSEMYLTAAESYAKLSKEDSARFYLDEIRKRANPSALPTTATGGALLDSIYKERRKELAFEGIRMNDLLRWKKGVNRADAVNSVRTLPYPSNKAIAPIPYSDVRMLGMSQNAGY